MTVILFSGCETEESLQITEPEASFQLVEPSASNIILNFSLPNNPAFTITWIDNLTSSSSYSVEMATDAEFASPVALGTSASNSFTMSVADFNSALSDAGVESFTSAAVFMRVLAGGEISNAVLFSVNRYPDNPPVITSPENGSNIALDDETPDDIALTVEWDEPDFSEDTSTVINYTVQAALPGTDFAEFESFNSTEDRMLEVSHSFLNNIALVLGLEEDVEGALELRVFATIETVSGTIERYSEPVSINVTPYSNAASLTTWGVVGSGYNNWGAFDDAPFYTTDQPNVIVAYVTLVDGEIKFRENNDWGNNFGDTGADGTLDAGGDNIAVTAGTYKITIDFNDDTYTMEEYSWGIVGSGYNNWGATPDGKFTYDYVTNTFKAGVKLLDGEIKFRLNEDWGLNYGDSGADGFLDQDGANIVVSAGFYEVTLDLVNGTYSIDAADIYGVVGSGYNDWGASPDFSFTPLSNDIWVAEIVPLVDGEIKFRVNEDWGVNFGDSGADGTLDAGGDNIAVSAGNYRIVMNLATSTYELNQIN